MLEELMDDSFREIVLRLPLASIGCLSRTSHNLNQKCLEESLWQQLVLRDKIPTSINWVYQVVFDDGPGHRDRYVKFCNFIESMKYFGGVCGCRMTIEQDEHLDLMVQNPLNIVWPEHPDEDIHGSIARLTSYPLKQAAHKLLSFLQFVQKRSELANPRYLNQSLHRYHRFMELQQSCEEMLIPCYDIENVWLSHLIRTPQYRHYCARYFGKILPHEFFGFWKIDRVGDPYFFSDDADTMKRWLLTSQLWKEKFNEDYFPNFSIQTSTPYKVLNAQFGMTGENVTQDREWLLWLYATHPQTPRQLSTSDSLEQDAVNFLDEALRKYTKFMYLSTKFPNFLFNPTYDIDLYWHTHMCLPQIYDSDMKRLVGKVLHHEAWPALEESLIERRRVTYRCWQESFDDTLIYSYATEMCHMGFMRCQKVH
eukprot:TRINITY_DN6557_c0_g1_i6.p1 TRINITY_DN6557_c0_g1~~TRINITY_DN6557_c0_g1_i6.p1  ORF type:complete len:424 (-),score=65.44 TRINITY_DN6557_c0_g1_i6:124-1395(-)